MTAYMERKGVKPTANRILVAKILFNSDRPLTLSDLENMLVSLDKSSIFRVLSLFLTHDMIHAFEDGRGVLNYEPCKSKGECNLSDAHIHFYCESCHRSFCMNDVPLPSIQLREGFVPHSVSFVIKGECPQCGKRIRPVSCMSGRRVC